MNFSDIAERQKRAFEDGVNRSADARRQNLEKLREIIKSNAQRLCDAVYRDLGKPAVEAFSTDIATVLLEIDYHLKHLKQWMEPESPGESIYTFPSK
ncbi:MAG: aldehyde dehydrogenase family protein, partial [Bacteroidota bacterium]